MFDVDSYSFAGPIVYNGEKSEKLNHDDLIEDGKYEFYSDAGWFGSIQHHFLSAVVPPPGVEHKYEVAVVGDNSVSSAIGRKPARPSPPARARRLQRRCLSGRSCSRSSRKLTRA